MPDTSQIIFIADDDPEDLELIEEGLTQQRPDVIIIKVSNGNDVIAKLDGMADEALPCLIILDYNMPEINGAQVLSLLCEQQRYEQIPKIILSTSNAPVHIQECMKNGATAYFVKPTQIKELDALATQMLHYCSLAAK